MAEREEIAADLVWRYVEQVRDSGQPLSPVELQDLAELLATAGTVPGALTADEETCRLAVRRRVEQVLARHAEPAPPAPSERTPARPPVRPLLWPFRLATAATVALSLALATVG
ncbi:MAG TPA: hypothetical protein VFU47_15430, partial [Armatimonadota bacterium]|nr:hypothetical protein [Armatimonadota bacterium]